MEFAGFHLLDGEYQALEPTAQGWRWSQQLGLYLGIYHKQLRFFTQEGNLVPSPEEAAAIAQERNQILAAKLQELGIDPEAL